MTVRLFCVEFQTPKGDPDKEWFRSLYDAERFFAECEGPRRLLVVRTTHVGTRYEHDTVTILRQTR